MKYVIDVEFYSKGKITVEADSEEEARKSIQNDVGLVMGGNIHTNMNDEDIDWNFDTHFDKRILNVSQVFSPKNFSKKEFLERASYHKLTARPRENSLSAVFFDWKTGDIDNKYFAGYKYCVWGRTCLTGKKLLEDQLYDFLTGKIEDTEYYVQLVIAETDLQRFKVPISGTYQNLIKR
jgi:hypothetical protein